MKRFLKFFAVIALYALTVASCYDDSALKTSIDDLKKQLQEVNSVLNDLKAGKVIKSVTPTQDGYTFVMSDGTSVGVKNGDPGKDGTPASVIESKLLNEVAVFDLGEKWIIPTNITGVEVINAFAPAGWSAVEEGGLLTITGPNSLGEAARKGSVIVVATSGNSLVLMTVQVALNVLDVNGSYWDALIDNPQYGGDLLYGPMDPETYTYNVEYKWVDPVTLLAFNGFASNWGSVCFSSGGEAISNWVVSDFKNAGYLRQLEVPVAPPTGSNFIVHYGGEDSQTVSLAFADGNARTIQSIEYVMTSYVANSAIYGDGYFGPMAEPSYLAIRAIGIDEEGNKTSATTDLIDGADVADYLAGTKTIEWKKWDLSVLGEVVSVKFEVFGSADCYGDWGFNAPAYFAYCDVVVKE